MSGLVVEGMSAGYGARPVLECIALRVAPGRMTAVLGPNGAGKSTLLRVLMGLVAPSAGKVEWKGQAVGAYGRAALARDFAWVPQTIDEGAGFTGLELVLMGLSPRLGPWGLPSGGDEAKARARLEALGIGALAERPATQMSGGEKRLVLLARALMQAPKVLFLDEPTAFLDLKHQVASLERVRAHVATGASAVAVLHDVNLATAFADEVVLLREGRVLAQGAPAEVLTRERLEALYGLPMERAELSGGRVFFVPSLHRGSENR